MTGFVYVMANDAMPDMVKVGTTSRHPVERAKELYTTGVPCPFSVEAAVWCNDPTETERAVHEHLDAYRFNNLREFFHGTAIVDIASAAVYAEADLVLCHGFAHNELIIDEGDASEIQHRMGVLGEELSGLLRHISRDAWDAARERRDQRFHRVVSAVNTVRLPRGKSLLENFNELPQ